MERSRLAHHGQGLVMTVDCFLDSNIDLVVVDDENDDIDYMIHDTLENFREIHNQNIDFAADDEIDNIDSWFRIGGDNWTRMSMFHLSF